MLRLFISLLGMCLLVPSGRCAQKTMEVKGVVQEVDPTVGTLTVVLGESSKKSHVKTFSLSRPDLPVSDSAGKAMKLTDLRADQRVFLQLSADEDILAIRLAPATIFGHVRDVQVAERTIVLKTNMGEKTVVLPPEVSILRNKEPARLGDLKRGDPALVVFSPDKSTVRELRTGKGAVALTRLQKTVGFLIELDRDKKSAAVLINVLAGDHSLLPTLTLSSDCTFDLLYQARTLRDASPEEIVRGVKVTVWSDFLTKKINHMSVELPTLGKRALKEWDPVQRRLTLEDPEGDRRLELSPGVRAVNAKGPLDIQQIRPGMHVSCGLSPDRQKVEVIHVWP